MLPVWMSVGLFGPMIVAAIYLIWRRRRGGEDQSPPDALPRSGGVIRELSQNDYRL